jgi:ABC-2 type transport system permease protein
VLRCADLFRISFQNLAIAIPIERDSGALKRLEGTPMLKAAYFVGKVILVAFVAVVQNVLLLAIGVLFYDLTLPNSVERGFTYAWVSVLGITACTLMGIATTVWSRTGRVLQRTSRRSPSCWMCTSCSPSCPPGCRKSPRCSR